MKYRIVLILALYAPSFFAGVNCIDNSEHLKKMYDDKEWHSVECDCSCETIKGGRCIECEHLQNAHPLTIIKSTQTKKIIAKQLSVHLPKNLQDFFNNNVVPYLQNR